MVKSKTQRTDELRQAAKRYVIAEEAQGCIEQHKFDRLIAQGFICVDPVAWPDKMLQSIEGGRPCKTRRPPKGAG